MRLVSDVVKSREIYSINPTDTVRRAVRYMCERKTGAVAVKEGEDLLGIFSERDLMKRVICAGLNPDEVPVRDVMTTGLHSVCIDDDIHLAKTRMFQNAVRHLVVFGRNSDFRGLVSIRALIEADMADSNELIHRLNDTYYQQALSSRWRTSSNRVIVEQYTPQP